MQGRIYISSAFTNLRYNKCKPNLNWLDNDPHFYKFPSTWGICRTDFRRMLKRGDYIYFVLPKHTEYPQMIYAYMKIQEHIDHVSAYGRYPKKRMRNGANPNGNIIVDSHDAYNEFDDGVHKDRFDKIKEHYIVGDINNSRRLEEADIKRLAPSFLTTLNSVFQANSKDIFQIIGRKGRVLSDLQINKLLNWLNS